MPSDENWDYELPPELIAHTPLTDRASSRLLVFDRDSGVTRHRLFSDIAEYLNPGDCLVLNNSRVIAARLHGIKEGTGARVEVFILRHLGENRFQVLLKPKRKVKTGLSIEFPGGLTGALVERSSNLGEDIFEFSPPENSDIFTAIQCAGEIPLPPYIKCELDDPERYQTVYSHRPGSVAAPTAGLHFTNELLEKIEGNGVNIANLDLRVGWGTFSKLTDEQAASGRLHPEYVTISDECVDKVMDTKSRGGKIVACGTTSVRALEAASCGGRLTSYEGEVDIFIRPGYRFNVVDRMITNFHLPGTSLLMLVGAFMGRERMRESYEEAIRLQYRFYSFGDAMLIL